MVESGYTIWLVLIILIVLLIYFLSREGENGYENIKAHPKAVTMAIFVLATLLFASLAALAHTEQARNQESTAVNKLVEEFKANRQEHAIFRQDLKETIRTVMSEGKELTVFADQLAHMNKMNDKVFDRLDKADKKYEILSEQLENCRAQEKTCAIERSEFKLKNQICQDKLADS